MTQTTYRVQVIGSYNQGYGYIWHIFKNLGFTNPDTEYIACVEFPNWNKETFSCGDIGYLTVNFVEEGVDKWFDGKNLIPYNYSNCIFYMFKHEQPTITEEIILD